jgi:hypothetical protein
MIAMVIERTRFHPQRLGHFAPLSFTAYGGKIQPPALRVVVDSVRDNMKRICPCKDMDGRDNEVDLNLKSIMFCKR